jgi:hypothetical protein
LINKIIYRFLAAPHVFYISLAANDRFLFQKMKFISIAAFATLSTVTLSFPTNFAGNVRQGAARLVDNIAAVADNAAGSADNAASSADNAIHPPQHPPQGALDGAAPAGVPDHPSHAPSGPVSDFEYWIARGFRPNRDNLRLAVLDGNLPIVETLIKAGVKPDRYHLVNAISHRNLEICEALIKAGVKPNRWHLDQAISKNNLEIVEALIKGGVIPDRDHLWHANLLQKLQNNQDIINALTEAMAAP